MKKEPGISRAFAFNQVCAEVRRQALCFEDFDTLSTTGENHHAGHNQALPMPPHLRRRPPLRQPMPPPGGVLLLPPHHPPPRRAPPPPPSPPRPLRPRPARRPLRHPVLHRRAPP